MGRRFIKEFFRALFWASSGAMCGTVLAILTFGPFLLPKGNQTSTEVAALR